MLLIYLDLFYHSSVFSKLKLSLHHFFVSSFVVSFVSGHFIFFLFNLNNNKNTSTLSFWMTVFLRWMKLDISLTFWLLKQISFISDNKPATPYSPISISEGPPRYICHLLSSGWLSIYSLSSWLLYLGMAKSCRYRMGLLADVYVYWYLLYSFEALVLTRSCRYLYPARL